MLIKLKTTDGVWRMTASIVLLGTVIIVATTYAFYPPERRAFQMALAIPILLGVALPIVYFMADQLHRNYLTNKELQRLIDRDRLTDVATRDRFFGSMARTPDAHGVSLMIDIDHFKRVNDTYGHLAGDQVLKHIAATMKRIVRDVDIVARFGGEEFVIFLHGADAGTGYRVAERMRAAIDDEAVVFEGETMDVTVSIGGALKGPGDDIKHAIREADDALYRAKDEGRNRTVFADGPKGGGGAPGDGDDGEGSDGEDGSDGIDRMAA